MTNPNLSEGTASAQRILKHTAGPIREGNTPDSIVSDEEVHDRFPVEALAFYGGNLIAESVSSANRRRLIACWNACEGVSTEWLEAQFSPETEELFGPTRPLDQRLQDALGNLHRALNQRDELVVVLREVKANAGNPEAVYRITSAAIARATGAAS